MGLEQIGALQGNNRFKRPYVQEINARTPYLPLLYAQKKEDQYRDKMYGLEKQGLALESDALDEAKKRNKTARNLGYANIGLGAGLGIMNNYDSIKEGVSSMFPGLGTEGVIPEFTGNNIGSITDSISPIDWDWSDAFTEPLKQLGSSVWDVGKGLYDSLVGDIFSRK